MLCIVISVPKIEPAGHPGNTNNSLSYLRLDRTFNVLLIPLKLRRAKHVRNAIEMKTYQRLILIWVAVMAGHRFPISMWPGDSM